MQKNSKKEDVKNSTSNKQEEILKIAAKYFFEQGYDNTSTRDIAKSANLSIAGLYYFFENKEFILFNIVNNSVERLYESLREAVKIEDNPKANLLRIIDNLLKVVIEHYMEIGLLFKEDHRLTAEHIKLINKKRRTCLEIIRNEIIRLRDLGEIKPSLNITFTAFSLIALTNWPHFWFNTAGSQNVEELAKEIKETFFHGILN